MNLIVQTTKDIISVIEARIIELKAELETVKGNIIKEVTVASRIEENQIMQLKLQDLLIEYLKNDIKLKELGQQN